jgi:DNA-binding GntR family transcriptional regulator
MTSRLDLICYIVLVFVAENKYAGAMSIATYIKEDIAAQLSEGQEVSAGLTLESLAEHYKVSLTPVRTAVAELIDEGWLEKRANRRLAPTGFKGAPTRSKSKQEQPVDHYEIVSSDLVQLSLKGKAIYLREEATAEKYNVSRSAIRNILHRLASEGMLDHIPRRGWRLCPFSQDDLQAFIQVREVLELKALALAQPRLDANELKRMLDLNVAPVSPASEGTPLLVDESLHEYLITTADNPYITNFFARQGRYYRLLFLWEDQDQDVAIETMHQHHEILTALIDQNWSLANKALSHHILDNHPILDRVEDIQDRATKA